MQLVGRQLDNEKQLVDQGMSRCGREGLGSIRGRDHCPEGSGLAGVTRGCGVFSALFLGGVCILFLDDSGPCAKTGRDSALGEIPRPMPDFLPMQLALVCLDS